MTYAQCPKRFYWTSVRPLPRFSGPAARIGTEIHGWIERRARGQGQLLEVDDAPDLTDEELAGDPGRVDRLRQAFLDEPVRRRHAVVRGARVPPAGRNAYAVAVGSTRSIGDLDGPWEVVDWKTGRDPPTTTPCPASSSISTVWRAWRSGTSAPEELTLTYVYLKTGEEVDPVVRAIRPACAHGWPRHWKRSTTGAFDPTPGPACRYCDFRAFCKAGQAWVAAQP